MPELPEVETTRQGIAGIMQQARISGLRVRNSRLRWPIPDDLADKVAGKVIQDVGRRAKYLLLGVDGGSLILHLGMSGSLRIVSPELPAQKHDHFDLFFTSCSPNTPPNQALRFRDPRRFGALLWQSGNALVHPLLKNLGPEPLGGDFNADSFFDALLRKRIAIKLALMDGRIVVGVGNIYANESLFHAGIAPQRPACSLTMAECQRLVAATRTVLQSAIDAGGSSLRDFVDAQGRPGYFQQSYFVYGRANKTCNACGGLIQLARLGQRATFWCENCQPWV